MSEVEKFIADLGDLVTSVKEQKQEISSLNENLREYGKRIHELESGLCQIHDSSDLERIRTIVSSLIKDELAKRNLVNSDVHEFFYKRVEELGIRPDFLRDKLKEGNTFVVGRIVLEAVLCQRLESTLPITLYTCDDDVIAGFDSEYQCPQVEGKCYNFSHQGVTYFRIFHHKDVDEMFESVDNDLTFCQNYFDGKNFIVRDTESVVKKRHIAHTLNREGMFDAFKPYWQFGFSFRFPKKSEDREVRKMTIMGIGSKPITRHEACIASSPISQSEVCTTSSSSELNAYSSIGDFFYRRVVEFGVDEHLLRDILQDGYTFVVGRIILEAVLCQKFDATLPIVLFTCKGHIVLPKLKNLFSFACDQDENGVSYTVFKNGDKQIFKVFCFSNIKDIHNAVEQPSALKFSRNFFNGKHFVIKDYKAVVRMRHTDYYCEDNRASAHDDFVKFYKKFGFTFHIEEKPEVEKVAKQTILCATAKPLQPKPHETSHDIVKPVTMADFINRHIQSLDKDAETISELMDLPGTVMIGDPVERAFRGNAQPHEHTYLICYNLPVVCMIMGRRGYESPELSDLVANKHRLASQHQYARAIFKCLNGKGTISIRVPKNDDKEFTEVYTTYTAIGGLNYDGKKFTKYRLISYGERTVTKEEFDSMTPPNPIKT